MESRGFAVVTPLKDQARYAGEAQPNEICLLLLGLSVLVHGSLAYSIL